MPSCRGQVARASERLLDGFLGTREVEGKFYAVCTNQVQEADIEDTVAHVGIVILRHVLQAIDVQVANRGSREMRKDGLQNTEFVCYNGERLFWKEHGRSSVPFPRVRRLGRLAPALCHKRHVRAVGTVVGRVVDFHVVRFILAWCMDRLATHEATEHAVVCDEALPGRQGALLDKPELRYSAQGHSIDDTQAP